MRHSRRRRPRRTTIGPKWTTLRLSSLLITARYGVPPVGTQVFVRVNQFVNGWEDVPLTFAAVVPAAA